MALPRLYLAVVLDLHSRKIVGRAMDHYMGTELVLQALTKAYRYRRPEAGYCTTWTGADHRATGEE